MSKLLKFALIQRQIVDQRKWVDDHGGCRAAYVDRYGEPGSAHCYGNGGSAIYDADMGELCRLEKLMPRF